MKTSHLQFRSISTLQNKEWLDDEIIDFFIRRVIEKSTEAKTTKAMKSVFFSQLSHNPKGSNKHKRIMQVAVNTYKKELLMNNKSMIIPICHQNHWSVIVIVSAGSTSLIQKESESKAIHLIHLDSMGQTPNNEIEDIIRIFLKYRIAYEGKSEPNIKLIKLYPQIPKQQDGHNCGIFMLQYLEKLYDNLDHNLHAMIQGTDKFKLTWDFDPMNKRRQLIKTIIKLNRNKILKIHAN